MSVSVATVVDEAIRYEQNLAALYQAFSAIFKDDRELWWELSLSEEQHAMLLQSSRALFEEEFAQDVVQTDIDALRRSNESLENILDDLKKSAPSREDAFRITLDLERDANEMTLHHLLKIDRGQPASEIVTRIHDEDSTHEEMVMRYAERHGISLQG